jgi:hypothetical protein
MSEPLKFHPLADLFPLMQGEEFDSLMADIKENGLREKIDLYQGKIVDGRNRYQALQRLGIDPGADPSKYFRKAIYAHSAGGEIAPHEQDNDARVRAYIISKNIHRRHLTAEQKHDLLVELVKASPEKSDRQLAKEAGTTHPTIAKARRQAEATGKALPVEKRTGADGKARKRPAKKRAKMPAYAVAAADMPTAEEAEESYQETLYDQACLLLESMADTTWERFLAHLQEKYHLKIMVPGECLGPYPKSILENLKRGKNKKPEPPPAADTATPAENAPPPDVGAEAMKAKMAALDPEPAAA